MGNLAVHMRIAGFQVSNEDVDTRQAAVSELVAAWSKLKAESALVKAAEIAQALGGDGEPEESLGEEVESAIQKHASAFLYSESPLEVGICAGVAAIELMSSASGPNGWAVSDIFATALWSALGFQPPLMEAKREALRLAVLNRAQEKANQAAVTGRERSIVAEFGVLTVTVGDEGKTTNNFKTATNATITALRRNAALDREELDFLWWVQLGRSRILNRPLASIDEPVRLVASGIEAAIHLRRIPSEVHRDAVLRTMNENPELDLDDLIAAIGDDREALGSLDEGSIEVIQGAPVVFPLLHALTTEQTSVDGTKVPRSSGEWGARALLEATFAKLTCTGVIHL